MPNSFIMESVSQSEAVEKITRQDSGQDIHNQSKWKQLKQSISLLSKKDSQFKGGISAWKALKEAMLKRKGLVEIGPQHANYKFTRKFENHAKSGYKILNCPLVNSRIKVFINEPFFRDRDEITSIPLFKPKY